MGGNLQPITCYLCDECQEQFQLIGLLPAAKPKCPRCGSRKVGVRNACSLEVRPPPWQYQCQKCSRRFQVEAPKGPDEAKAICCPACGSREVKWLVGVTQACATGG